MDRLLFVAASGLRQITQAQEVNANNLANASTVGFQADLTRARALYLNGPYHPDRVFTATESPAVDFAKGSIRQTGRALDVAVSGQGWIAVQAPDGSEAYTRRGDLRISPEGLLETGNGLPVLGDGGPISPSGRSASGPRAWPSSAASSWSHPRRKHSRRGPTGCCAAATACRPSPRQRFRWSAARSRAAT